MKEIKFKYKQHSVRLWLLQVALFFSVFAFSGFNEKIQDSFHESDKTELVESQILKPVLSLNSFTNTCLTLLFTAFPFDVNSYRTYALLHFKKYIVIKYKAALKETLSYKLSSIKLPIKITLPSSSDEMPPFILG